MRVYTTASGSKARKTAKEPKYILMAQYTKDIGEMVSKKGSGVLSRKMELLLSVCGSMERKMELGCRLIMMGLGLKGIGRRIYGMGKELRHSQTEPNT